MMDEKTLTFIEKAKEIYGNQYDYSESIFKHCKTKIIIMCKIHGIFERTSYELLNLKRGCQKCKIQHRYDEFVNKSNVVHNNRYEYSIDYKSANYIDYKKNVIITCKIHGIFEQAPKNHLKGYGCKICGKIGFSEKMTKTKETFISEAKSVHGDIYDYTNLIYINKRTKVLITCKLHGDFLQYPQIHLKGSGCTLCANIRMSNSKQQFLWDSQKKHGNKYDYSKVKYVNNKTNVIIICKKHGKFEQRPSHHLSGHGCVKCSNGKSYSEIAMKWIYDIEKQYNISLQHALSEDGEYKISNTRLKADGFHEESKTVYEFHGDLWHGNPKIYDPYEIHPIIKTKTYGQLFKKTLHKELLLRNMGYNYVCIWEHEYNNLL